MHRANIVIGSGGSNSCRSTTLLVEESDATATSTFLGVDGHSNDFSVDDGADEATTTTMIYVKKECNAIDDDDDNNLQHKQRETTEIEDVSIGY